MPKKSSRPQAPRSSVPASGSASTGAEEVLAKWLTSHVSEIGRHRKVLLNEVDGARDEVLADLRDVVRQHYVSPADTAQRLADLGAEKTAALLREELPTKPRARSADMGEILAAEFVEQELDFNVPIRRLQWKDGREMALRGDDVVAFDGDGQEAKLRFLKGEAKSRTNLAAGVVEEAAAALDREKGRPTRHSVLFVAKRLRDRGEHEAAALLENAVLDSFRGAEIEHLLFTFCGNDPDKHLTKYLEARRRKGPRRHAIGLRVEGHPDLVRILYQGM